MSMQAVLESPNVKAIREKLVRVLQTKPGAFHKQLRRMRRVFAAGEKEILIAMKKHGIRVAAPETAEEVKPPVVAKEAPKGKGRPRSKKAA